MRSRVLHFSGRFPCTPTGARRARKLAVDFASAWMRGEDLMHFEMACGEALANCAEHGDGPTISIDCWFDAGRLIAEIRHHGRGFVPPPIVCAPPRGALRGYGLFIMQQVVDRVEFLDGGTGMRLIKFLPA